MKFFTLTQIGFPFHPSNNVHGNPTMYRLRVAARSQLFSRHSIWKRLAAKLLMVLTWPIAAAYFSIRCGIDHRAKPSRVLDAWWLALSHNVPPLEYFLHRLWKPDRRARVDDYLYWTENGLALAALNHSAGLRAGPTPVEDKHLFSRYCSELELPTPTVYSIWQEGSHQAASDLPEQDLWLKPACGKGGIGAERWRWCDTKYLRDDEALTPEQMIGHIAMHSRSHHKTLVQEVIQAHAEHDLLIGDAPLCARILTGLRRSGTVEVLDAMGVWPRNGAEITQGGHVAMIDLASGRIEKVFEAPETCLSRQMEGQILPEWPAVLEYVRKAHAKLPHFAFLGWDVAFGREGPVLLEANSGWGSFHFQVVPDRPIADTGFASIAFEYL